MWVVGFFMQILGIILYYQKGLYADCGMEFYYLSMTVYGFWMWMRPSSQTPQSASKNDKAAPPTFFPSHLIFPAILILGILWFAIWWLLVTFTNSNVPVADSFTTAMSVVGIWALARKYVEQWLLWIAVDAVSCYLYFLKEIPFKGSLYALYVVIAIIGYWRWRRQALATA